MSNYPSDPDTTGHCKCPDRDVAGLICGCPLPCPWHTLTIDTTSDPPALKVPITSEPAHDPKLLSTLKDIGRAIIETEGE